VRKGYIGPSGKEHGYLRSAHGARQGDEEGTVLPRKGFTWMEAGEGGETAACSPGVCCLGKILRKGTIRRQVDTDGVEKE